jgi:ribosome biogenesis GTPase / thiamine phosphate phosphatase
MNEQDLMNMPTLTGMVYTKHLGSYIVKTNGQKHTCSISTRLRKHFVYPTADPSSLRQVVVDVEDIQAVDPVAIGDHVLFTSIAEGVGIITEVLPRKNKLARRAAGKKLLEQVMVANVDQVVAVFSAAYPAPKWNLLDRYLVTAEASNLPAIICITKLDLVDYPQISSDLSIYQKLGYQIVLTSSKTGEGLNTIRNILKDRISVMIGKSGVGKTSLLNAIQIDLGLRVNSVGRESGKGKHTTTSLEMFDLDFGGQIVDTPGMREFSLWDIEDEDLPQLFPEMRPYIGKCKYGFSCQHVSENGCAIRGALSSGLIDTRRYDSYIKLRQK